MNLPWHEEWMQNLQPQPKPAQDIEETDAYENVEEELDDTEDGSLENLTTILKKHGTNYKIVEFKNVPVDIRADPVIVFETNKAVKHWGQKQTKLKVIDVGDNWPRPIDVCEWITNISEVNLYGYLPERDKNKEFWSGVFTGYTVYHGTEADRITDIMKNGLEPRSESRGITNRWDGAGVYTSADPQTADQSYEVVIEINVSAMKADGYMPQVRGESPITENEMRNALAQLLGAEYCYFEVSSFDGLAEDTLVFKNTIPPKYLRVLEQ